MTTPPPDLVVCPCQWGSTTWCTNGQHDRCRAHTVTPPETYLTNTSGDIVHNHHGHPVQVWLTGRTCQWRCPCTCHTTPTTEPTQTTLF